MDAQTLANFVAQSSVWLLFCALNWAIYKHGDSLSNGNIGSDDSEIQK